MFSEPQVKALSSKLSAKHVRTRQHSGLTLSYIEGWHTIAEANRIFGYDAWDRQTMAVKCVWEGLEGEPERLFLYCPGPRPGAGRGG